MKKTLRLFAVAFAIMMIFAVVTLQASAKEAQRRVDPVTLEPTSERVIFIKDAPEGGTLAGSGLGNNADNPLQPLTRDDYDPDESYPKHYLMTSLYQATELLGETGGTIVICGPVKLGLMESHGSAADIKDTLTHNWGTKNVIKFTSVYNGVDYRETSGAKLIIETPANLILRGSSVWENIDIETKGSDRVICFSSCPTLIGKGVNCYPYDELYEGVPNHYISLAGGHRYAKGDNQIPTLTVQSGTYNKIAAGLWGAKSDYGMNGATSYLTLEGTTTVLNLVSGTIAQKSLFEGHVNITINGGTYKGNVYGVGETGFVNTDGTVEVVINGGDFKEAWSLGAVSENAKNNRPLVSTLDMSGFTTDKLALAYAYMAAEGYFDEIRLPGGVTGEQLLAMIPSAPPAEDTTESEEVVDPVESTPESTDAVPGTVSTNAVTTKAPATTTAVADGDANTTGEFPWLIVGIIAAVVAAGVVVVVILGKKKKNNK